MQDAHFEMTKLTPMQARFIDEYLIDLNANQAAIRAGYSAHTARSAGHRLLTNVYIIEALAKRQAALVERVELSQDWVINTLRENCIRAMEAIPVLDKDGNEIGTFLSTMEVLRTAP